MIHIVTKKNRELYGDLLREMHRLRKVHFVDERGWSAMTVKDGGEYDAYDDDQAIYLLAVEPNGAVACSMRMRPAEGGSILADVFPHLLAEDEPSIAKPDVWEISRYFASSGARGKSGFRRRAEIRLASLEVALEHRVKRLVGMIDIEMLAPMLNGSGWRVRPLGLPVPYPEGVAQAIEVQVSRGSLVDLEESQGLNSPISFEVDAAAVPAIPPQEIESLLRVASGAGGRQQMLVRVVKRLIDLQDHSSEDELVATIEYLSELIERGVVASA